MEAYTWKVTDGYAENLNAKICGIGAADVDLSLTKPYSLYLSQMHWFSTQIIFLLHTK